MGIGEERGSERNEFRFHLSSSLCKKVDDWDVLQLCSLAFFLTFPSLSLSPFFLFLACLVFLPYSGILCIRFGGQRTS